ncbi:MAG TPA: FABP family protein [Actinomycetota bacterium]|nr:FABP family protein [Actinomycetota bacterium]
MEPALHPDCEPLAFLLGTWSGEGRGHYPTIKPFAYGEEVRFWHVGKPFLAYSQRTWALDDSRPLHTEAGYWRPKPEGRIEIVLVHPTGITEIQEGTMDGGVIAVRSTQIGLASTAKDVTALSRVFRVESGTLTYDLEMAAVGLPLQHHLNATLERTS